MGVSHNICLSCPQPRGLSLGQVGVGMLEGVSIDPANAELNL